MNASQRFEMPRIETLDADRQPVDAGGAERAEFFGFERAGVGFERDFRVSRKRHARAHGSEYLLYARRGKNAGCAAAEKNRVNLATPDLRQRGFEVGDQRINIALLGDRITRLVRIEIAVRAFAHAPRDVDVEGERGQRLKTGRDAGRETRDGTLLAHSHRLVRLSSFVSRLFPRRRSSSRPSACALWLMRFFSAGLSSAPVCFNCDSRNKGS